MTKKFQLFPKRALKMQNPLEYNPQLFREIKGKISGKNIFLVALVSLLMQLFVFISHLGELPDIGQKNPQYSRYCTGVMSEYNLEHLCESKLGIWQINWELFWHDIFIFFSIVSIFILLIAGTYLIITDLIKEEKTGTLNFIRLSPQSASNILAGKILGVPILVYFFIVSIFPLHLIAGLKASIPGYLILLFDLVLITSCAFTYSFAVLFSLLSIGKAELKPWIATFIIALFLLVTTAIFFENHYFNNSLAEYLLLLNPVIALPYLLDKITVADDLVPYMNIDSLGELLFYRQAFWQQSVTGIGFILLNYCLGIYWFWQGAIRLFYNPTNTILSKKQSYWFTGCFVIIALGFTLQNTDSAITLNNLMMLQCLLILMFLGLIAALSPHRQTLYDWARYRHQSGKYSQKLGQELILGEKSPSTIAIALNALIATTIITIGLVFFPIREEIGTAIWGLILTMGIIIFYAVIAQGMLLMKSDQRAIWTAITISFLIIIPPTLFAVAEVFPDTIPLVWFFSFIPAVATENASIYALLLGVLGQWLAITFVSLTLIKKLRQAGRSETQQLLETVK